MLTRTKKVILKLELIEFRSGAYTKSDLVLFIADKKFCFCYYIELYNSLGAQRWSKASK